MISTTASALAFRPCLGTYDELDLMESYYRRPSWPEKRETKVSKKTKKRRRQRQKKAREDLGRKLRIENTGKADSSFMFRQRQWQKQQQTSPRHSNSAFHARPVLPDPGLASVSAMMDDNAPQVLLWTEAASRSFTSSTSSEHEQEEEQQDEERTSPPNLYRTEGVHRQSPSPNANAEDQQEGEEEPWEIGGGAEGPKWYQLEYWRQKLSTKCCLPEDEPSPLGNQRTPIRSSNIRYRPFNFCRQNQLDYRAYPSLYRTGSASPSHGFPYHSFVRGVPFHQLSPMSEVSKVPYGYRVPQSQKAYCWHLPSSNMSDGRTPTPPYHGLPFAQQPHSITPSVSNDINRKQCSSYIASHSYKDSGNNCYENKNSCDGDRGRQQLSERSRPQHTRSVSSLSVGSLTPPPPEQPDLYPSFQESLTPDYQSVSSLEPGSPWHTPGAKKHHQQQVQQEQSLTVTIPPDTQPTTITRTSRNSNNSTSHRVHDLRRRANTGDSPRVAGPSSSSKPPVAPRRRTQSASGQKVQSPKHANSMASLSRPRDLDRCFSETSGNTSGSRHRRGGTVMEFSFESVTDRETFRHNIPKPPGTPRSVSLPVEVKVPHRPPPSKPDTTTSTRDYDDFSHMVVSVTPDYDAISSSQSFNSEYAEADIPDGYISPLEEEANEFAGSGTNHYEDHRPSPSNNVEMHRGSLTEDTVDFVTGSPHSSAAAESPQSNPQDSLHRMPSRSPSRQNQGPYTSINDNTASPPLEDGAWNKLRDPPAIPSNNSWMWKWVNNQHGLDVVQENAVVGSSYNSRNNDKDVTTTITTIDDDFYTGQQPTSPNQYQQEKVFQQYLPKNKRLEEMWSCYQQERSTSCRQEIGLTGWVAFSMGDCLMQKLRLQNMPLESTDIGYIVAPNETSLLWVNKGDTNAFEPVDLQGCQVEMKEISRDHGRAVVIGRGLEVVCTLLPISLPNNYEGGADEFRKARPFPRGEYLPDDQQYSTMHIMFSLDALIKTNEFVLAS